MAEQTVLSLLPLDAAAYRTHPVHARERIWTETNCYVDLWIELLHALDLDPIAAGAFTLSTDFEGDQWTFFKFPPEDIRLLYGLDVNEMNVWRPVIEHVEEQLGYGRLLTVEVDSWFLPDTAGVSYQLQHTKSTIVPQLVDRANRRLGYFHNAGYFELSGDDFDGVFRLGAHADAGALPPYVELVKLERRRCGADLLADARELTRAHLARRPADNPVSRMGERLAADMPWLRGAGIDAFHQYAFGTCRQCGACAELTATFADWLGERGEPGMDEVAAAWRTLAERAKALQFALARAARGRTVAVGPIVESMAAAWDAGMSGFVARYGG
jgi:hypothetical protein